MKRLAQLFFICLLMLYFFEEKFFISKSYAKNKNGTNTLINHSNIIKDKKKLLIREFKNKIKYKDQYKSKIYTNYSHELITIETIYKNNLNRCIVYNTIVNILSKKENLYKEIKSLINKVNPSIYSENFYKNYINKFTKKFLQPKIQIKKKKLKKNFWLVTIQVCPIDKKACQYLNTIYQAAKKYGIDPSLILAIIQIESGFNPDAVSRSDALGLMQIVQHTAGRDVFKMKGKIGKPSRNYLLNPCNNIDIGTAYLSILQNSYLNGIINPISKRYAVISAYHSGVRSVLKVFSKNQNSAFKIINKMKPDEVYRTLYTKHPSIESRRYLKKVSILQKIYML